MRRSTDTGHQFTTIFGRNLVGELPSFVHRPYLVVTMADLWDKFCHHFDRHLAAVHRVDTIDGDELEAQLQRLPACQSVVGLGGGQAIDTAKYFAWRRRLPLFQVPTALTVNAPWGHRAGLRFQGHVRYLGFVVPEAVYVDYEVIQAAPPLLNRSGVGDVFCYHTAHADWRLTRDRGLCEPKWPYDEGLVAEAGEVLDEVMRHADDIHAVSEKGIRVLATANRWGGAAFHNAGWNPRHIEGIDHFVFYALEHYTGRKFIHGQPVCLGVYVGSLLHGHRAEEMLETIRRVGVDIRPEAMGITWGDVEHALVRLPEFVREAGLWHGTAHEARITPDFVARIRERVEATFGPWRG